MSNGPFELNIRILAPEHPARYVQGMTVVGCMRHDQIVWLAERDGWRCPICGFAPSPAADDSPLVVKSIDHRTGTVVVG